MCAATSSFNHGAFSTPFVGRRRELAELRAALEDSLASRGRIVLLAGEPGIGKTRTATEFALAAEAPGCRVWWGRCFEWEGAPAYWPWIQILRAHLDSVEDDLLREELGDGAAGLAQIVPEIRQRLPDIPPLPPMEPDQARFDLFESITAALARAALHRPVVLILDDLHWADQPSLLLLQFVAQTIGSSSILVVGTFRDVEVTRQHPLAGTLAELSRLQHLRRLTLSGLPRGDMTDLIEGVIDQRTPAAVVDAIFEETEGNPFFTAEVVRLLASEGRLSRPLRLPLGPIVVPESVRETIDRRLDRLSPECNRFLSIGSVIGREFSLALLERVTRESAEAILRALEEAIAARLIETLDPPTLFRFSHALVQETIYTGVGVAQRLRLHATVGETLEQFHAADPDPHVADLAHHFYQASSLGLADKAVAYLTRAAHRAEAQLAWESAISQYERALQVMEQQGVGDEHSRCETLLALGDAHSRSGTGAGRVIGAGNSPAAVETYMTAARVARAAGLAEHFAQAAFGVVGISLSVAQGFNEASELMREALVALPDTDSPLRARLLAGYAAHRSALMAIGKAPMEAVAVAETEQHADEAVEIARRLGDPAVLSYTLHARCHVNFGHHRIDEVRADAEEAVGTAVVAGEPRLHALALFDLYQAALFGADFDCARRTVDDLRRIVGPLKTRYFDYIVGISQAGRAMRDGRLSDAERHIESALESWPGGGIATWELHALRREEARASEALDAVTSIYEQLPGVLMSPAQLILGLLHSDRIVEARSRFNAMLSGGLTPLAGFSAVRVLTICAEICCALGDREHAMSVYGLLIPHARLNVFASNSDYVNGSASMYLGMLATTLERWGAADRHFADALEMNERWAVRPAAAWTRYHWADMLVRHGDARDRERARDLLTAAETDADEMDMVRLSSLARALADRAGLTRFAGTDRAAGLGLSQREMDVLRLIVSGQTDKEIGGTLSISPRTVSTHVTNILNKLGAGTRTEAAMMAVRAGVLSPTDQPL